MEDFDNGGFVFQEINNKKLTRKSVCEIHGEYEERGFNPFCKNTMWFGCAECKKIIKEKNDAEILVIEQHKAQEKIERRLKKAGIPERFRSKNFENYIADNSEKTRALTIARDYAENFDFNYNSGSVLIFSGKAGTGKSHLAIAIAQFIMTKRTALYSNALDLVRLIRDTWRKDSEATELEVLDMLGNVDLLIIDEVGVQYGTDNEQMLMFDIINRRYRDLKPMILLTNLGTAGLSEYLTERSYDRLRENGKWVTFEWESYRSKAIE